MSVMNVKDSNIPATVLKLLSGMGMVTRYFVMNQSYPSNAFKGVSVIVKRVLVCLVVLALWH